MAGSAARVGRRMDLDSALHQHFGFSGFRRGQREACEAALAEGDVLVVMPTGSGKSLCYQLPALLRRDLTIVVSPLVALIPEHGGAGHAVERGAVRGRRAALRLAVGARLPARLLPPRRRGAPRRVEGDRRL